MLVFWGFIALLLLAAIGVLYFALSVVRKIYFIFSTLLLPMVAFFLYLHWGHSQELAQSIDQKKKIDFLKTELSQYKSPQELINKMKTILQKRPADARGWFLLGRLYRGTEQYQLAETAFFRACQLAPDQLNMMQQYVEISFKRQGKLENRAHQYLQAILKKEPDNLAMLNILAMDAYAKKDYIHAVQYWKKILPHLDPQSEMAKHIVELIASQCRLGFAAKPNPQLPNNHISNNTAFYPPN